MLFPFLQVSQASKNKHGLNSKDSRLFATDKYEQ